MGELYAFKQDKIKYESQIQIEQNEFIKQKLTKEFQDRTKRYLGAAISIINANFNINYSMNKEAMGMTASFRMINSIVRKSDEEILTEMKQLDEMKSTLEVNDDIKETIGLAIDIVKIYCTESAQNQTITSEVNINVFENNKIISSEQSLQDDKNDDKKDNSNEERDNEKKVDKKDGPFILYKFCLGLIVIPVVSMFILVVFLFAMETFSKTAVFNNLMSNEIYSDLYPTIFYGLIVLLSGISAGFVSSFISVRTNNKIAFTAMPLASLLLLMTFSSPIIKILKDVVPLKALPSFLRSFEYSYILISIYGLMLFLYLFAIFQKHIKTSIIEIFNILIIIYVGILPGLAYILNVFEIDYFLKLIDPIYDYPNSDLVKRILLSLCIISSILYSVIKNYIMIRSEEKNIKKN